MHNEIIGAVFGVEVDHENHDTLDNRRINLRFATKSQQAANRRLRSDNRSGVKGVRWNKGTQSWRATITAEGKQISLGCYPNITDAKNAYNEAAKRYHGEFACL